MDHQWLTLLCGALYFKTTFLFLQKYMMREEPINYEALWTYSSSMTQAYWPDAHFTEVLCKAFVSGRVNDSLKIVCRTALCMSTQVTYTQKRWSVSFCKSREDGTNNVKLRVSGHALTQDPVLGGCAVNECFLYGWLFTYAALRYHSRVVVRITKQIREVRLTENNEISLSLIE